AATSKGLTNMKANVSNALKKKNSENNQIQEMGQQLEQMNQQLQQTSAESEQLQKKIEQLNAEKLKLEQEKFRFEQELGWFKAKSEKSFKEQEIEAEKQRVQLEGLQLLDNNKNNDEIRNE
ncbi:MAG: hypothetical protein PQJ44_07660, partial [Sphaerochaetaceae bacterium]|nr:hypothetical protein [Sphaerochaetaceae bacterium]